MKIINTYIFVFVVIIVYSCGEVKQNTSAEASREGVFNAHVTHSAGERWSKSDSFLTLPMNIGNVGDKEVLIISDRIDNGQNVNVTPLGAINIMDNDSLKTFVIVIPNNIEDRIINADGFDEFSTIHSSAKWIIEQYLINRGGGHSTRLKSWDNEKSAINYLLN